MSVRKDRGLRWQTDFQIRGKRHRYYSAYNTCASAKALESRLRQAIANGEDINPILGAKSTDKGSEEVASYRVFAEKWYDTYVLTNNKPSTHHSKRNALDFHLLPWFGDMKLDEIRTLNVEEFKAEKQKQNYAPKTINNHLSVLHKSLMCAEEWELIERVPRVRLVRVSPTKPRFLSREESERLLACAENGFWFAMILCALRTGMRIGELCALDWSDISWDQRTITVRRALAGNVMDSPKNNRIRTIPLTDDLYELFNAHKKAHGFIFSGPNGNHIRNSGWAWRALARACVRASLPVIGWHVLRHTFASELTAQGVPLRATQMLLGHSTIAMTERYSHLAPSSLQDAISFLPKALPRTIESPKNDSYVTASWRDEVTA